MKNDFTNRNDNWCNLRIAYMFSYPLLEQGEQRMRMTRDEVLTAEEVEGKNKKRKEELKKEAEVYYSKLSKTEPITIYDHHLSVVACYIAGAEPREKQIQIDAEQIRALQKQNGELTDRVNEAREIIKAFLSFEKSLLPKWANTRKRAEQFLGDKK